MVPLPSESHDTRSDTALRPRRGFLMTSIFYVSPICAPLRLIMSFYIAGLFQFPVSPLSVPSAVRVRCREAVSPLSVPSAVRVPCREAVSPLSVPSAVRVRCREAVSPLSVPSAVCVRYREAVSPLSVSCAVRVRCREAVAGTSTQCILKRLRSLKSHCHRHCSNK